MPLVPLELVENDHDMLLTPGWPAGYHARVRRRAREADFRLTQGGGHNVLFIDFANGKPHR